MANNIKIGQIGENLACQYLINKGYYIIERNYRQPWGELDIICRSKDRTLVFIEVKALKNVSHPPAGVCFTPENNLSPSKLKKVKRTSYIYANNNPNLINSNRGWRIDLIAIDINHPNPENSNINELSKYSQIRHYENL